MPYFEFEHQLRAVGPGVLTIGSGPEAGWRILGHDLASVHVIITPQRDGRALVIRGAPDARIHVNGTESREGRAVLSVGDTIRIGTAEFAYRHADGQGAGRDGYLRDLGRARLFALRPITQIGRDPHCEVLLPEPNVSRLHAEVRLQDERYVVRPVGSADTSLNGRRLTEPAELTEGDELTIGSSTLRFTREMPRSIRRADEQHPAFNARAARMPTVVMGLVQARERMRRDDRRKVAAIVAGSLVAVAFLRMLITR
jgi:predicted component of type VI protein secretion system